MIEDAELLRRYAEERSEAAFAELVRRHLNFVYGVALRQVGDAHRAEDVVQEVFAILARKAASLARRPVLGGWLYRTAQFTAIDVVRVESRRRLREQKAEIMNESPDRVEEVDGEKLRPLLDQTMSELNDADRDAVWLRFFAGLSFVELGSRLQLSENTARMRVARALDKMHASLSRRGVRSTTAALGVVLAGQAGMAAPPGLAALVTSKALSAAAGGTGTIVAFMSMGKLYTAAGAALVVAGAVYWHQQNAEGLGSENTSGVAGQNREIPRVRDESRRPSTASTQPAAVRDNRGDVMQVRDENPPPNSPAPDAPAASVMSAAEAAQARELILRRYEKVFRQLELSSEQREKLTTLLVDFREAGVDFAATAASTGEDVTQNRDLFSTSVAFQRRQIQAQIEDLLGEETYFRFQAADVEVKRSASVEQLQTRLKDTDSQLNSNQIDQLLGAMKEARVSFVNQAVVNRAGGFLTPVQRAALQDMQQQRRLGYQAERIQQAVGENLPGKK